MQLKIQTSHSVYIKTTHYVLIFLFPSYFDSPEAVGMYSCSNVLTFLGGILEFHILVPQFGCDLCM